MKFIRKHLNEGVFKNPEQARITREKEKSLSNADKLVNVIKDNIQAIASEKFDEFIKSKLAISSLSKGSVFSKLENGAETEDITYKFEGDTIVCTCTISLSSNGLYQGLYQNSGARTELVIRCPEYVSIIENKISYEFDCPAKVKIKLVQGDLSCAIFKNPTSDYQERKIILRASMRSDLTDFCHLMNCIEGLEYWKHKLVIAKDDPDWNYPDSLYTEEPLIHKFECIQISGYYELSQLEVLPNILSNEVTNEFYRQNISKIYPTPTYTGMIIFCLYKAAENLQDVVTAGNKVARIVNKNFSNYPNVYINVRFVHSDPDFNSYIGRGVQVPEHKWNDIIRDNITTECDNLSLMLSYCGKYSITQNVRVFNAYEREV